MVLNVFISTHEGVIVYIVNCISDIEFHPIYKILILVILFYWFNLKSLAVLKRFCV